MTEQRAKEMLEQIMAEQPNVLLEAAGFICLGTICHLQCTIDRLNSEVNRLEAKRVSDNHLLDELTAKVKLFEADGKPRRD